MIAVIGGVKIKLEVKMKLPEAPKQDNWAQQLEQSNEPEDAFEAMQEKLREEQARFWQGDGAGNQGGMMGQLSMVDGDNDEINVISTGCAFNVAKHLADMGNEVKLITVIGTDPLGLAAMADMQAHNIDVSAVKKVNGQTPVLFEIKNFAGEIEFARANEKLTENITKELICEVGSDLAEADAIMVDGSIPQETLLYIAEKYGDETKIFFDPASRAGGDKVNGESEIGKAIMQKLYCIMPGRVEAEKMAHMIILGPDQLSAASNFFAEHGVERSIITIKGGGIYYREKESEEGKAIRPDRVLRFADTTGAGDLVSAAVIHETLKGAGMDEVVGAAMQAAADFLADLSDERPY